MNTSNSIQTNIGNTYVANKRPSIQPINEPIQPLPQEPSYSDLYEKLSIEQQHELKRAVEDSITQKKNDLNDKVHAAWQFDVAKSQYNQQVDVMEAYMNASGDTENETSESNSLTLSYLDYQQDAIAFKADVIKAKNKYDGFDIELLVRQQSEIQQGITKGYQESLYESGELLNLTV